jgi:hypothetical protein
MAKKKLFTTPAYTKLKMATQNARFDCQQAKESLRVHRESHG